MSTGRRAAPATEVEKLTPEIVAWRRAIRLAVEQHDASLLALHLTRGQVPNELRDDVYRLVVAAPWRDAKPGGGRLRKLNKVDEIGVVNLYTLLSGGFLLLNGRRQKRQAIVDHLAHKYEVSPQTIERILAASGRPLPTPPRVLRKTKTPRVLRTKQH